MKRRVVAGTIAALALSVATLCHVHAPELVAAAPASGSAVTPDDSAQVLAATPPMGWNSWDGYGLTINEEQYRANVSWMAEHLKKYGWQYAVIDQDWFVANPTADGKKEAKQFQIDAYGRFIPAANRFPSVTPEAGFKPLADWVHSRGMKFGVHPARYSENCGGEKSADRRFEFSCARCGRHGRELFVGGGQLRNEYVEPGCRRLLRLHREALCKLGR